MAIQSALIEQEWNQVKVNESRLKVIRWKRTSIAMDVRMPGFRSAGANHMPTQQLRFNRISRTEIQFGELIDPYKTKSRERKRERKKERKKEREKERKRERKKERERGRDHLRLSIPFVHFAISVYLISLQRCNGTCSAKLASMSFHISFRMNLINLDNSSDEIEFDGKDSPVLN